MTGVDALLGGGDYTADGLPDLVLRHRDTGTIEVLPGTGTGSVPTRWARSGPSATGTSSPAAS